MKMEALEAELADVNNQLGAIERIWQDKEESQKKKLTDAQKKERAADTRDLRRRKKELEKDIAELKKNPPPKPIREAPERGRAKKEAGKQRRLDAEFEFKATAPGSDREHQIDDVMTRAYEGKGRSSAGPQLNREIKALWEREERPGKQPPQKATRIVLKTSRDIPGEKPHCRVWEDNLTVQAL